MALAISLPHAACAAPVMPGSPAAHGHLHRRGSAAPGNPPAPQALHHTRRATGLTGSERKLYPDARHEPFDASNRVIGDLLDWRAHLPARPP